MATDPRVYTVSGLLIKETEKALLIEVQYVDTTKMEPAPKEWFPKTQIVSATVASSDDRLEAELAGDAPEPDQFEIKHWILSEKGLVK